MTIVVPSDSCSSAVNDEGAEAGPSVSAAPVDVGSAAAVVVVSSAPSHAAMTMANTASTAIRYLVFTKLLLSWGNTNTTWRRVRFD
jgi:hypothetical protein